MPPDRPEVLLRKGRQDELVLQKLLNDPEVDDDTLGFHAQQAAEKILKAVLASRGVDYPKTHNLRVLIELLAENGIQFPEGLSEINRLTQFGTTFRYDNFEPAPAGERFKWLELIQSLRAFLEPLLR
jgi:HEPN domain-containing protein